MQQAYDEYNEKASTSGKSRGHFMVDLCRPGHLTACLRNFQECIACREDNWDAQFGAVSPCPIEPVGQEVSFGGTLV